MHELGIVFHIIDSIEEVGRQNKLRRVSTVTLGWVRSPAWCILIWRTAGTGRRQIAIAERLAPRHRGAARRYPVRGLRQHLRHGGARQNVPFLPKPAHASRQQGMRSISRRSRRARDAPLTGTRGAAAKNKGEPYHVISDLRRKRRLPAFWAGLSSLLGLIAANELARRSKKGGIFFFRRFPPH